MGLVKIEVLAFWPPVIAQGIVFGDTARVIQVGTDVVAQLMCDERLVVTVVSDEGSDLEGGEL